MEIQHGRKDDNGMFYVEKDNEILAELYYVMKNERMVIEHTEVSGQLEGKGVGKQLVAAAVKHARENELKIVPLCSFAKGVMERVEEYHDVL